MATPGDTKKDVKIKRSWEITGGASIDNCDDDQNYYVKRTGPRSQLYGAGFQKEDFNKATVTVSAPYMSYNMCNQTTLDVVRLTAKAVESHQMKAYVNTTPVVSDAQTMGSKSMRYSLVSRDLIADCIECMTEAYKTDGAIVFGGCDKTNPGAIMALARMKETIGIFLYPGTTKPGKHPQTGEALSAHSPFEAVGKYSSGLIDLEELHLIEQHSCPGSGACAGMFTANTMSTCIEALGMSIPYTSTTPAVGADNRVHPEIVQNINKSIECLKILMERNIRVRDIITKKSLENAIAVLQALGGSTNAVLHLLAIANEAQVDLQIDDFNVIADKTPFIGNLTPCGKYNAVDLHYIGGLPIVMKHLLKHGLIHGDCLTVTGKTVAENLQDISDVLPPNQDIIHPVTEPVSPAGQHIVILKGTLSPGGSVIKLSGKDIGTVWKGPVLVCDNEQDALQQILSDKLQKGTALIIKYEGPAGAPGMPEMLGPSSAMIGRGLGPFCPLITDARFSGATHGIMIAHVTPEAIKGGPLAIVENGDEITIDLIERKLDLNVPHDEIKRRLSKWNPPPSKATNGLLKKYASLVTDASHGATSS